MIVLDGMTKENYNQRNSNWEKHLKTISLRIVYTAEHRNITKNHASG